MAIGARETFEFDLNGYVVIPGAVDRAGIARMNEVIDASPEAGRAHKFHFLGLDPLFLDLLRHPTVEAICAAWLHAEYRLDHAFGVQHFAGERDQRESLHGGPWAEQGYFQYQWHAGRPRCTSLLFGFALEPQRAGDGGLIVVPGSHKSNVGKTGGEILIDVLSGDYRGAPWVVQPVLEAGDLVVMTEATMHGTEAWRAPDRRRRMLYYQYALSCVTWLPADDAALLAARRAARTDTERRLLRPAYVSARSGNVAAWREPTLPGSGVLDRIERAGTTLGASLGARAASVGARVLRAWRR